MAGFRFGIASAAPVDATTWRPRVRMIEDLGYNTLHLADHLTTPWATFVAGTVAAAATNHLCISPLVCNVDFRHPMLLAQEAATFCGLFPGRLELGIGAGWLKSDYTGRGRDMPGSRHRISQLAEGIDVLRVAWSARRPRFTGQHYQMALNEPVALLEGDPPPLIVGGAGRRVLSLAAREADVVSIAPNFHAVLSGQMSPETLLEERFQQRRGWLEAETDRRLGVDFEIQCLVNVCVPEPGAQSVVDQLSRMMGLSPAQLAMSPTILTGAPARIIDQLQRWRELLGISYWSVPESSAKAFAPVVSALRGS